MVEFAGELVGNRCTHAVAEQRVRSIDLALPRIGSLRDDGVDSAVRILSEPTFAAGQVCGAEFDRRSDPPRPIPEHGCRATCKREHHESNFARWPLSVGCVPDIGHESPT